MKPTRPSLLDADSLDQLGGVTGVGWTVSVLGYLTTVIGYGNALVSRLISDPQSFLYVGSVLFVATLGLNRLQRSATEGERAATERSESAAEEEGAAAGEARS
jgi:large-conductance mechanosensitive channel